MLLKQKSAKTGLKSIEWVAGLFEGEGWLSYDKCNDSYELGLLSTDLDVMWDLYEALGLRGNLNAVRKDHNQPDHYKPRQTWRTRKRDLVFELVQELYPYMGERRRAKMDEFIEWYQEKKKK